MSALIAALDKLLTNCPFTRCTRSEVCHNDLRNDQCKIPNSTNALIDITHERDVRFIPCLAEDYREALRQAFRSDSLKARSLPWCPLSLLGCTP